MLNKKEYNNCCLCNSNRTRFIDHYKYNIDYDQKYLGTMNILICDDCELFFCDPMPSDEMLENYYSNIYRSHGRFLYESDKETSFISIPIKKRVHSQLNYLSTFINLENVKNILDFGSGSGDFGFVLKNNFKNINLYALEQDINSINILNERGYNIIDSLENTKVKYDVISCFHSLEHLNNLNIIPQLVDLLSDKGVIYFEVPNCEFNETFLNRPYDSPHLLFFNKKNISNIAKFFNLKILNITTYSNELNIAFENQLITHKIYKNWQPDKKIKDKNKIRKFIKKIIPKFLLNILSFYNLGKEYNNTNYFINNKDNQWLLRGVLKKK